MANKTFADLLQDYVNKPYEELLELANDALAVIVEALIQVTPEDNAAEFILPFIATTLASDGRYSELEHTFLNDVLQGELTYDEAKTCMQAHYNPEIFEAVDKIIDACGQDLKSALIVFCLCFAAVDETITREESAYLAKLLS
jgi:hypothetical protein